MNDREFVGRMVSGNYALLFKRCGHVMELPAPFVNQFENEHDMYVAVEKIECSFCKMEFNEMEKTLNAEFRRLMENGGLK